MIDLDIAAAGTAGAVLSAIGSHVLAPLLAHRRKAEAGPRLHVEALVKTLTDAHGKHVERLIAAFERGQDEQRGLLREIADAVKETRSIVRAGESQANGDGQAGEQMGDGR